MRFDKLDLNLLVALNTLAEEMSVSKAAMRLNLSQSAMSGSLARLREYFNDPLFVKTGRTLTPTPFCVDLAERVKQSLILIRSSITTPIPFDAPTSDRCFSIVASDYVFDTMLSGVIREVSLEAPNILFELAMPSLAALADFGRGALDIWIIPEEYAHEDQPAKLLFEDFLVAVAWSDNSRLRDELTLNLFLDLPHVEVSYGPERVRSYGERALSTLGINRNVDIKIQTFSSVPAAVLGTDRLAVMNALHAQHFAKFMPLKIFPLPVQTMATREVIQWHSTRKSDQGLKWIVQKIMNYATINCSVAR